MLSEIVKGNDGLEESTISCWCVECRYATARCRNSLDDGALRGEFDRYLPGKVHIREILV